MRQRCPDALFIALGRLPDYRWMINSTGYANVVPSPGDVVYGTLCFLSKRDEEALDESEGVPWMYEKHKVKVWRLPAPGQSAAGWGNEEEQVEATVYVDLQRLDEGKIDREVCLCSALRLPLIFKHHLNPPNLLASVTTDHHLVTVYHLGQQSH